MIPAQLDRGAFSLSTDAPGPATLSGGGHLDLIRTALRQAETHLCEVRTLDPGQLGRAWLRSVRIHPNDGRGEDFAGRLTSWAPSPAEPGQQQSVYEYRLGRHDLTLQIEHEPGRRAGLPGMVSCSDDLTLALAPPRPARSFPRAAITSIDLDPQSGRVTAVVDLAAARRPTGLGARYATGPGLTEVMAVGAELARALLHEIDDVPDHLAEPARPGWMRSHFTLDHPDQAAGSYRAELRVTRSRMIRLGAVPWRLAELRTRQLGYSGTFSVAYPLPDSIW